MNTTSHRKYFAHKPERYSAPGLAKRDVIVAGSGDVWETRYQPALISMRRSGAIQRIANVGRKSRPKPAGVDHYFCAESGLHLPVESLRDANYLTAETLCVIATPPVLHAELSLQALLHDSDVRIAVEKPLSHRACEAARLSADGLPIIPLDHKLTTESFLETWNQFRANPDSLLPVRFLRGDFLERHPFAPHRAQEHTLRDTVVHLLNAVVALAKTRPGGFWIEVDTCTVACHQPVAHPPLPGPAHPTAVRLTGWLGWPDAACLRFELNQAKAASLTCKQVALYDCDPACGRPPLHLVHLRESGWRPHRRALCLLVQPQVKLPLALDDAIGVISLLDRGASLQQEWEPYAIGTFPAFIRPPAHAQILRAVA